MRSIWFRSNSDNYRWLSNFYLREVEIPGVLTAKSAEHAYQALKTEDLTQRQFVLDSSSALEAKHRGRAVPIIKGFVPKEVMRLVLVHKFADTELRKWLLATGDSLLVEDNPGPWGGQNGGANWLGTLLMDLRRALKEEAANA